MKNVLLNSYLVSLPQVKEEQWTFSLQFYLDQHGLPALDKASINAFYYEDAPTTTSTPTPTTTPPAQTTSQTEEKKDAPEEKKPEKIKKEKQTLCIVKPFECTFGMPQDYFNILLQKDASKENEYILLTMAINKRNEIENFIYSTRGRLDGELSNYISQDEKDSLIKLMNEMEQWLYSGSEDVYVKSFLDDKVKGLNELGQKIYKRYHDWDRLSESLKKLEGVVALNEKKVNDTTQNIFLNQADRDELKKLVEQNTALYKEAVAKFEQGSRISDSPIPYDQVEKAADEFVKVI